MTFKIKTINVIDYLLPIFFGLFIATLTNSIFLNQIGYFGSLLLILVKYSITKENRFSRTKLELPFLFYLLILFLSSIFSIEPSSSFENLIKRVLLIPVFYSTLAFCDSEDRLQKVFRVFSIFAVISILVYLTFAINHFINNLYGLQQSGPGIFHYPITTSEIMGFVVVIFFAFFLNQKGNFKKKTIYFLLFSLSFIALISTYKRTGWIGAIAGILFVIILNRKYILLILAFLIFSIGILLESEQSSVSIFRISDEADYSNVSITTTGKAQDILPLSNASVANDSIKFILSDYTNGLVVYDSICISRQIKTPQPIVRTIRFNDSVFISYHSDTRFSLIKISDDSCFILDELISPGFTHDFKIFEKSFFVLDKDSGLTVFNNLLNNQEISNYKFEVEYEKFYVDSQYFVLFKPNNLLSVYFFEEGKLNFNKVPEISTATDADMIFVENGLIFMTSSNALSLYSIENKTLKLIAKETRINSTNFIAANSKNIFFGSASGKVFSIDRNEKNNIKLTKEFNLNTPIHSLSVDENWLYTTYQKSNKFKSIIDPFNQSNATRLQLWEAGYRIALDYPVFGVGDIDLASTYVRYKDKYSKEIQGHLHNNFFHILATLGFSGIIAFLLLLGTIIYQNVNIYLKVREYDFLNSLSLGINGAFVSFIVSGLTEWNFGDHEIITMVWFLIGLNFAIIKILEQKWVKNQNSI